MKKSLRSILCAVLVFQISFVNAKNDIEDKQRPGKLPPALDAFRAYSSEPLTPGDLGEMAGAESFAAEMDVSQEEGLQAVREAVAMKPDDFEKLKIDQKFGIISKIMMMGHGKKLKNLFTDMMNKMFIEGDRTNYVVKFSPSLEPNAGIYQGHALMVVNAGLIAYASNVDELSYVVAHEMTHDNQKQLEVMKDKKEVDEMLSQISGYNDLEPAQREEIRADLGAIDRVIQAGYNPWGGYNFMRKMANFSRKTVDSKLMRIVFRIFSKRSFDYWEAHPASEIRMAAMKGYIVKKSNQQDLADNLAQYNKFPVSLNLLRYRMGLITYPLMNVWFHRGIYGYFSYQALDWLYLSLFGVSASDTSVGREIGAAVGSGLSSTRSTIGQIFSTAWAPVKDIYYSSETMQAVVDQMSTAWSYVTAGASSVGSAMFVGSALALPVVMLGGLFVCLRSLYSMDPQHKSLVELRAKYSEILDLFKQEKAGTAEAKLSLLLKMAELPLAVESIYNNGLFVRWFRSVNKLSWIRLRMTTLLAAQIQSLAVRLQLDRAYLSEAQGSAMIAAFDKLPGYIFESPLVQENLRELVKQYPALTENGSRTARAMAGFRGMRQRREASKAETIALGYELWNLGMKDSAYRVIGLVPEGLVDFAYSTENKNPALPQQLTEVIRGMKAGERSLGPSSYLGRKVQELWVTSKRVAQIADGLGERLRSRAFTQALPYPTWRWINPRAYVDLVKWASPGGQMDREFKNIRELRDFAEIELVSHNADMSTVSNLFVDAIRRNPHWISTEEDFELLLKTDYFWPSLAGTAVNFTELEALFAQSVKQMIKDHPHVWKYEPASSEKNHQGLLAALRRLGKFPTDFAGQRDLWLRLTSRGVTSSSDALFNEVYAKAGESQRAELERLALKDGRIWEPEIKVQITRNRLAALEAYQKLMKAERGSERTDLVKTVIKFLEESIPERGRGFAEILEDISVAIRSSAEESTLFQAAKTADAGGERQEDLGLRVLSDILNHVLEWKKKHQWEFVRFLRGEIPATPKVQAAFRTIGPERIRRMFELLPTMARTVTLDAFLDAPTGLLGKISVGRGWSKTIVDNLMEGKTEAESQIARELLTGFLYALKRTGNKPLQSYVLSYLLALPKSSSKNSGDALKSVLEIFGTTGIKIGQFLAASNLLPDAETAVLRTLQEQAKVPAREEVYADLRGILGTEDLPFDLLNLLGAASLKYAMLAREKTTGENVVLKVLRLESVAHTRLEFKILEKMAEYLVKKNGAKYGIFGSIVTASRKAVERELVGQEEVYKGRLAGRYVYVKSSDAKIKVSVPRELLVKDRMIVSEFAEGISFFALRPEVQPAIADKILQMEHDILMDMNPARRGDEIMFDPDRHAGNYRIQIKEYSGESYIVLESATVTPIDFGQLLRRFTRTDRDLVIHLFALAQIADKAGAIDWIRGELEKKIELTDKQRKKLAKTLRLYFPSKGLKPVTAYYGILSALELAGVTIDIKFYDFVRAIIQLKQYEPFASPERAWKTPSEAFEGAVMARVNELKPAVQLSWRDKLTFAWNNPREAYRIAAGKTEEVHTGSLLPMPKPNVEEAESCEEDLESAG